MVRQAHHERIENIDSEYLIVTIFINNEKIHLIGPVIKLLLVYRLE
jgi:hypothetical protein